MASAQADATLFRKSLLEFVGRHGGTVYFRAHELEDKYLSIKLASPFLAEAKYWSEQPMTVPWHSTGLLTTSSALASTTSPSASTTTTTIIKLITTTTTATTVPLDPTDRNNLKIWFIIGLAAIIGLGLVFGGLIWMLLGDRAEEQLEA